MIPVSTVTLTVLLRPLRAVVAWRESLFKSPKGLEGDHR